MANLSLRIKADFDEASRQFKALGEQSENARAKIAKFTEKFKTETIDRFIERQDMAAIAMQATGRETESLNSQVSAYQREIERLIKLGLDPQDESLQRLQTEYTNLKERQEAATQATEAAAVAAKAHAEEEKAKAAALERSAKETVELLTASSDQERQSIELRNRQRELKEEMERLIRSGLSPQSEEVQRLTREHRNLENNVEAAREAQERKTRAVQAAKTTLKAAAVAVAGVAAGMVALAKRNADLANGFANSARTVNMSIEAFQELDYVMRMSGVENGEYMLNRLNRSVIDVRNETGQLTKFLKENYYELLEQLQAVENNEEAFTLMMDAISRAPNEFAAAELAMAAFGRNGAQMVLTANQGAEGINALREEARQLGVVSNENAEAAMQFNDAMYRLRTATQATTQELTSQLLPTLTNIVVRATNVVQRFGEFQARVQSVKSTVRELTPVIASAAGGVAAFVAVMKGATYIKAMVAAIKNLKLVTRALTTAKTIAKGVKAGFLALSGVGLGKLAGAALAAGAAITAINLAIRNARDSAEEFDDTINSINFPMFSYMAEEVADLDVALTQLAWGGAAAVVEAMEEATEKTRENLRQRLNEIEYTANQEKNININIMKSFLVQRAKLESEDWEERYAFLREKQQMLLELETLTGDERIAVEYAVQKAIQALQEETVQKAEEASNNMLKAFSIFFGGFGKLLGVASRENRAFFVASRMMALVQAGINTALGITKALSTGNFIKAAGIGMKGAAQKAVIAKSMIPSAETGGRFIVPNTTSRVDGVGLRVNPNERIDITPAGQTGDSGGTQVFNLIFDGQVLATAINELARSGDLHELQLAGNL